MAARTLYGRRQDGSYGLDISFPGYDVLTATDDQLAFSSRWGGAGSILQIGNVGRDITVSFPTLSYIPIVVAFPLLPNGAIRNSQFLIYWPSGINGPSYSAMDPMMQVTNSSFRIMPVHSNYQGFLTTISNNYKYAVLRVKGG